MRQRAAGFATGKMPMPKPTWLQRLALLWRWMNQPLLGRKRFVKYFFDSLFHYSYLISLINNILAHHNNKRQKYYPNKQYQFFQS